MSTYNTTWHDYLAGNHCQHHDFRFCLKGQFTPKSKVSRCFLHCHRVFSCSLVKREYVLHEIAHYLENWVMISRKWHYYQSFFVCFFKTTFWQFQHHKWIPFTVIPLYLRKGRHHTANNSNTQQLTAFFFLFQFGMNCPFYTLIYITLNNAFKNAHL